MCIRARCPRLTAPVMCVWATAQLRCAFARGANGLLHLSWVYGLWSSCIALSRELSKGYCTLQGCMAYGIVAVSVHARCQRLTAPVMGIWSTAQLRCAFTRIVNGLQHLQHLTRVFGLRHNCDAPSRELLTAYSTCHGCRVYGAAA